MCISYKKESRALLSTEKRKIFCIQYTVPTNKVSSGNLELYPHIKISLEDPMQQYFCSHNFLIFYIPS